MASFVASACAPPQRTLTLREALKVARKPVVGKWFW